MMFGAFEQLYYTAGRENPQIVSTKIPQGVYPQMAQISADQKVLFLFEQRILIHPDGEESMVHNSLKICAISEICGFICDFWFKVFRAGDFEEQSAGGPQMTRVFADFADPSALLGGSCGRTRGWIRQ